MSLSDSAGTVTSVPGRLIPLLSETIPPSTTRVVTRGPSTDVTSKDDPAVVDEDAIARMHVVGESVVRRRTDVLVT